MFNSKLLWIDILVAATPGSGNFWIACLPLENRTHKLCQGSGRRIIAQPACRKLHLHNPAEPIAAILRCAPAVRLPVCTDRNAKQGFLQRWFALRPARQPHLGQRSHQHDGRRQTITNTANHGQPSESRPVFGQPP